MVKYTKENDIYVNITTIECLNEFAKIHEDTNTATLVSDSDGNIMTIYHAIKNVKENLTGIKPHPHHNAKITYRYIDFCDADGDNTTTVYTYVSPVFVLTTKTITRLADCVAYEYIDSPEIIEMHMRVDFSTHEVSLHALTERDLQRDLDQEKANGIATCIRIPLNTDFSEFVEFFDEEIQPRLIEISKEWVGYTSRESDSCGRFTEAGISLLDKFEFNCYDDRFSYIPMHEVEIYKSVSEMLDVCGLSFAKMFESINVNDRSAVRDFIEEIQNADYVILESAAGIETEILEALEEYKMS
jgi:hypothetical protein